MLSITLRMLRLLKKSPKAVGQNVQIRNMRYAHSSSRTRSNPKPPQKSTNNSLEKIVCESKKYIDPEVLIYYIPFAMRPKIMIDTEYLSKLKPNPCDDSFIADERAKLLKQLQELYGSHYIKWSEHLLPGHLIRWAWYFNGSWWITGNPEIMCTLMVVMMVMSLPYVIYYERVTLQRKYSFITKDNKSGKNMLGKNKLGENKLEDNKL